MPAIRAQFVEAAGWSSWAIGRFGGGGWAPEYSHVDCMTSKGELVGARDDVINGIPAGVQIRPQGYARWKHRDIWSLEVSQDQSDEWDHHVYSGIGAKYDEDAIRSFVFGSRKHTKGEFICSAYFTSRLHLMRLIPKKLAFEFQAYSPNAAAFGIAYLGFTAERHPLKRA